MTRDWDDNAPDPKEAAYYSAMNRHDAAEIRAKEEQRERAARIRERLRKSGLYPEMDE